ncbi:hypothetical protein SISNIDRAFT_497320 [Sistotremastrum niveocremeum HHB9708]|uniref:Nudix hydrolase domain-containing protein n=1 Tax=Sistotremastrum niveocremeum HHB9708 TaxID=1314777 RepID=A0A164QV35_9AGAM|nr:hypothetical protein SISNIDRAFT_497320 [Sistotremastrum niveocremeum HHB9708]
MPRPPRPSASLIIVNHKNEVLLVQRNPSAKSWGNYHVFPGGVHDEQDASFQITAIRETFEEAGILVAADRDLDSPLNNEALDHGRKAVHSKQLSFKEFTEQHGLTLSVDALLPFTQWVTPPITARRFHAHFFVYFLPHEEGMQLSVKEQRLPTPDGGLEVISAAFWSLTRALKAFDIGEISLMPPQFYILQTLAQLLEGERTDEQEMRIKMLSESNFGKMVIRPEARRSSEDKTVSIMLYEGDELRGGPQDRRHRTTSYSRPDVNPKLTLERNFDIFTESPATEDSEAKLKSAL